MDLKEGDVFYTNKVRSNVGPRGTSYVESTVHGHFIALTIGYVPKDHEAPTSNRIWQLIGEAGLVGLDHVEECLGKKAMDKLIKFCEKKFKETQDVKNKATGDSGKSATAKGNRRARPGAPTPLHGQRSR